MISLQIAVMLGSEAFLWPLTKQAKEQTCLLLAVGAAHNLNPEHCCKLPVDSNCKSMQIQFII